MVIRTLAYDPYVHTAASQATRDRTYLPDTACLGDHANAAQQCVRSVCMSAAMAGVNKSVARPKPMWIDCDPGEA